MNSIPRAKLKGIVFPPSGEASIASGYTPAAVPGRSPDPLWTACGPKGREKKTAHVWPYEPLCALFRQRAAAMHPRRSGPRFGNLRRPKEKAGERTGAFVAPVRSQLPAVRAVLKWRSSACEIEAMTLFSAKFSCLLRAARTLWGVPGLFERFKHE